MKEKRNNFILCFLLLIVSMQFNYSNVEAATKESVPLSVQQEKVQRILSQFVSSVGKNPQKYKITVEDSDQINAYATLGKRIVVYSGLIDTLSSEAGLAFVIAHELGHIEERHVVNSFLRNHLLSAVKYFFFRESAIYDGVNYLHSLHYSRGGEKEADLFAANLVNKFYCNASGKLEFFQETAQSSSTGKLSEYLSTHPNSQSRLKYLEVKIKEDGCKI